MPLQDSELREPLAQLVCEGPQIDGQGSGRLVTENMTWPSQPLNTTGPSWSYICTYQVITGGIVVLDLLLLALCVARLCDVDAHNQKHRQAPKFIWALMAFCLVTSLNNIFALVWINGYFADCKEVYQSIAFFFIFSKALEYTVLYTKANSCTSPFRLHLSNIWCLAG